MKIKSVLSLFVLASLPAYSFPDPVNGPSPASTGSRIVFHVEDYPGTSEEKINKAGEDANTVEGAVVLGKVYEINSTVTFRNGVMYTGGGLRRSSATHSVVVSPPINDAFILVESVGGFRVGGCVVVATNSFYTGVIGKFIVSEIDSGLMMLSASNSIGLNIPVGANVFHEFALAQGENGPDGYSTNIIIDSVLFDGNVQSNGWTHHWRYNNTMLLRGSNTVRNCYFLNTPSENIICCGGTFVGNTAINLAGSFVHKGCPRDEGVYVDVIQGNYVDGVNLKGDEALGHSEGAVTLSYNSKNTHLLGNIFKNGKESVLGRSAAEDLPIYSSGNYYAHFPRFVSFQTDANPDLFFSTNDILDNVTIHPPVFYENPCTVYRGRLPKYHSMGYVEDDETQDHTVIVTVIDAPIGITVSGITTQSNGAVKGYVHADLVAAIGQNVVKLKVEDATGVSSVADYQITVKP